MMGIFCGGYRYLEARFIEGPAVGIHVWAEKCRPYQSCRVSTFNGSFDGFCNRLNNNLSKWLLYSQDVWRGGFVITASTSR